MLFAWIKLRGNNERGRHYVFKEEAAGLSYLVAFFTAYFMLFNDVIDVIDDVLLRNGIRYNIRVVGKKKTHLLCVIADGAWRIMLGSKHIEELLQCL